jgi:Ion channel
MSAGLIAVGAAGGLLAAVALADVFVTVFNYDGFTFLTARAHRLAWHGLRAFARSVLPDRGRDAFLSLASAAMLPATVAGWLVLEVTAFAMMYLPGMASGAFSLRDGLSGDVGAAAYFSAGDITSLTFGDVVARTGLYRALTVAETGIGLATVSLAVAFVLAALDALGSLNRLHGRVRRQATEPNRPATIIARHFRGGHPDELSSLLQSFAEDLEDYDQGLRRYPVVFYFHTRRAERSIPRVFAALGDLIELLRWGLPAGEPVTGSPYLLALTDEYTTAVRRLQRSFVGPAHDPAPAPLPAQEFWQHYHDRAPADPLVAAFRALGDEARHAAGVSGDHDCPDPGAYQRYRQWLPFHSRRQMLIDRVSTALGYPTQR